MTSAGHSATSDAYFLPCFRSFGRAEAEAPRHRAGRDRLDLRHHRRDVQCGELLPKESCLSGVFFTFQVPGPRASSGATNTHEQLDRFERRARGRGTTSRG